MVGEGAGSENPPPGWYSDPSGSGRLRWWDGHQWTERTSIQPSTWRQWITTSAASLTIDRWVARTAGLGLVASAVVVATAVLGKQAIPSAAVLLLPAIPAVFLGQLWVIAVLTSRMPKPEGDWRVRMSAQMQARRNWRTMWLGGLPKAGQYLVMGSFAVGWVAAMTAFPSLSKGNPIDGSAGCPWALENHGSVTCVSHSEYQRAQIGGQRLAAGVMMGFFAMHFGVATSEVRRRLDLDPDSRLRP